MANIAIQKLYGIFKVFCNGINEYRKSKNGY